MNSGRSEMHTNRKSVGACKISFLIAALFVGPKAVAADYQCRTLHGNTLCTYSEPQACYINSDEPRKCVVTHSGGMSTLTLLDTGETIQIDKFNSGTAEVYFPNGGSEAAVMDHEFWRQNSGNRCRVRTGNNKVYIFPC